MSSVPGNFRNHAVDMPNVIVVGITYGTITPNVRGAGEALHASATASWIVVTLIPHAGVGENGSIVGIWVSKAIMITGV